jgi:pyruvate, water dikinase
MTSDGIRGGGRLTLLPAFALAALAVLASPVAGCGDDGGGAGPGDVGSEVEDLPADAPTDIPTDGDGDGDDEDAADGDAATTPDGDAEVDAVLDAAADAPDGDVPDGGETGPSHLTRLESPADLAELQAAGGSVKYLARVDGREPPTPLTDECLFQNTRRFPLHLQFLHHFPELVGLSFSDYMAMVLRRDSRVWWGGDVRPWPATPHPVTGLFGVYTYTVYAEATGGGGLTVAEVAEVDARLKACAPFAADLLVFLPDDVAQQAFVRAERAALLEAGVVAILPEELRDRGPFTAYSVGEGYGTLRVVPPDQALVDYGPRDLVVTKSAPNDISIVAGLITADPQSLHSHVNLRLLEKGIPNAGVASIYDNAIVRTLDGFLVHLVVTEDTFVLEPARLEDAEAFWEAHRPHVGELTSDLTVTAIARLEDLTHADALAYGAKAANLGELTRVLPPEHRRDGLALPFRAYADFIEHNGLDTRIAQMLANPRLYTDRQFRRASLSDIRRRIATGVLDEAFFSELQAHLTEHFGEAALTTRIRFRSSTNAEDLAELTGAGLYDSRSGCLGDDLDGDTVGPSHCLSPEHADDLRAQLDARLAELAAHPERVWLVDIIEDLQDDLAEERPVARALRRVWASLWTERAFDEREYYGLDHLQAFMGVAIHAAFVMEQANTVAVTELRVDGGDPLYRLVSQVGYESVVRPDDPTALAEVQTFRRRGDPPAVADLRLILASNLVGEGERVLSPAQVEELAGLLFAVQAHFEAHVYPALEPLVLDLEIKVTADGRLVIKQARPFVAY